ncbi:MAG: outer membrane beta-barrel protein [Saprospiraceae bacterium]|nr:outer membrane beta-barrel protein [Saprospiraceae bacterium]
MEIFFFISTNTAKIKGSSERDSWFSPVIIGKYVISKAWKIAIRAGYFQDKTGIIIPTITPNAFKSTDFH